MRQDASPQLESLRAVSSGHPLLGATPRGANYGFFVWGSLRIISGGSGQRWEHVSVSCEDRCPTWEEMARVKTLFWGEDETVLQLHPRRADYVNDMPFCLHLWKQRGRNHPLPPQDLI
jgi:hypothetical protein